MQACQESPHKLSWRRRRIENAPRPGRFGLGIARVRRHDHASRQTRQTITSRVAGLPIRRHRGSVGGTGPRGPWPPHAASTIRPRYGIRHRRGPRICRTRSGAQPPIRVGNRYARLREARRVQRRRIRDSRRSNRRPGRRSQTSARLHTLPLRRNTAENWACIARSGRGRRAGRSLCICVTENRRSI